VFIYEFLCFSTIFNCFWTILRVFSSYLEALEPPQRTQNQNFTQLENRRDTDRLLTRIPVFSTGFHHFWLILHYFASIFIIFGLFCTILRLFSSVFGLRVGF